MKAGKVKKLRIDLSSELLLLSEVMVDYLTPGQFKKVKRYHKLDEDTDAILLVKQ